MLICIRGAGDLASGIAVRLFRSNFKIVMLDIQNPTSVRRSVSFSEAIRLGKTSVEGITAYKTENLSEAIEIINKNFIAVLVCPDGNLIKSLSPDVVVDAIIAKKNLGTNINDAPIVIGVGPGFTVGTDCNAVIETKRGHTLGRAFYENGAKAIADTGIPGNIAGYSTERVLRAPCDGIISPVLEIGNLVKKGDVAATVDGVPLYCSIDGMLRGILAKDVHVTKGMKCGDIDPRGSQADYLTVSDKALAVAGGVLEAILHFLNNPSVCSRHLPLKVETDG